MVGRNGSQWDHGLVNRVVSYSNYLLRRRRHWDHEIDEWRFDLGGSGFRFFSAVDLVLYPKSVHRCRGLGNRGNAQWIDMDTPAFAIESGLPFERVLPCSQYLCRRWAS